METMILEPTVHECIETIAKKKYWFLVEEYAKSDMIEEEKEREIDLLRKFLEEADIAMLRSETENRLGKGENPQVIIQLDEKGNLKMRVR